MTECTGHGFIPRLPRDAPPLRFSKPHAPRARGELPAPGHASGMRGLFGSFVRPRARPCARHTRVFKILSAPRVLTCGALCAAGQTAGAAGCACFPPRSVFQNPARPDVRGALRCGARRAWRPAHVFRPVLFFKAPCAPSAGRAARARPCARYARAFWEFCPPVRPAMRPAYESFQNFIRPARPDVRGALRCGADGGRGGMRMFFVPFHFSEPHTS